MMSDAENWEPIDEFEEAWKEYAEIVEEKMLAAEELGVVEKAELSKEEVRKDAGVRIDLAKSAVARIFEKAKKLPEKERESIIKSAERIMVRAERVEKRVRPVLPEPIEAVEDACAPEHAAADTPEPKVKQPGRPPSNAPAKLGMIVSALIEYAGTTGQTFDPQNAPGPLGDKSDDHGSLHWFCARIDQDFAKSKKTFSKQRAGLLAVESYAKPTNFYRLALPHIAPKIQGQLKLFSERGKG